MKKYLIIILCTISGISFAQLPLKTFEKSSAPNMFIGVDATDSLAQWKPLSGIGYSTLADSSKWTVSGTNLFPKKLTYDVGIGIATPSQQLEITESFETPATTSATTGVWYKGATPFIHNFQHPTGGGAVPSGYNFFAGGAGNFTMGSTATGSYHSSYNIGISHQALANNTKGYVNIATGYQSMRSNTEGYSNTAYGFATLYENLVGAYNNAIGDQALRNSKGYYNNAMGGLALYSITGGDGNVGVGGAAGRYIADGVTGFTGGYNNIYIGYSSKASGNPAHNEIVIGALAIGNGTNTTTLGGSATTKTHIPYGGLRLSGLTTSSETAAVMIDGNKDLSYRTLNAAAFNGTIDSTTVVNSYGTTITESPSNQFNIKVDSTKFATTYDIANSANWDAAYNDKINSLAFSGTTTKTLTLTQQDGGTVSNTFTDIDTDTDTQDLSIDSTGRVFTIGLTDGGTIKFEDKDTDTNTTYTAGYGLDLATTEFKADTSELATQYDLSQINFIDSTTVVNAYGTTITQSPANQFNITVDTSKIATQYDLTLIGGDDTQDLSIDSLNRVFTISLTDGGSVKFKDTDTQLNEYQVDSYVSNNGYLTTEIDGSITNEIQDLSGSGATLSGYQISLSSDATPVTLPAESDGNISNEGSLSVASGSSTTSIINSNTSGSTGVTIEASTGLSITETTSKITLTNSSPNQPANLTFTGSASPYTLNSSDGTDVTFTAGTGIGLSATTGNITITNTSSGLTGSGAANRMAYFTGTSTLKGSTLITNDSTATTSMLNVMHTSGSGINGLRLFTTNSTPTGTNLRWQLANVSGNLVFNGANTSSLFKVQTSGGVDKFTFDPQNGKIGFGATPTYGSSGQFIGVNATTGAAEWQSPATPTVDHKYYKRYRTSSYLINHSGYKAIPFTNHVYNNEDYSITGDTAITVPSVGYYELKFNAVATAGQETGGGYLSARVVVGSSVVNGALIYQSYLAGEFESIGYSTIIYVASTASKVKIQVSKASGTDNGAFPQAEINLKRIE